jgi:NADH-quinone oxidoreductase subunit N
MTLLLASIPPLSPILSGPSARIGWLLDCAQAAYDAATQIWPRTKTTDAAQDLTTIMPEIILSLLRWANFWRRFSRCRQSRAAAGLDYVRPVCRTRDSDCHHGRGTTTAFSGMFVDDAFFTLCQGRHTAAAAVLVMSQDYMAKRDLLRFEYPILIALSVVGMMMMVSAI